MTPDSAGRIIADTAKGMQRMGRLDWSLLSSKEKVISAAEREALRSLAVWETSARMAELWFELPAEVADRIPEGASQAWRLARSFDAAPERVRDLCRGTLLRAAFRADRSDLVQEAGALGWLAPPEDGIPKLWQSEAASLGAIDCALVCARAEGAPDRSAWQALERSVESCGGARSKLSSAMERLSRSHPVAALLWLSDRPAAFEAALSMAGIRGELPVGPLWDATVALACVRADSPAAVRWAFEAGVSPSAAGVEILSECREKFLRVACRQQEDPAPDADGFVRWLADAGWGGNELLSEFLADLDSASFGREGRPPESRTDWGKVCEAMDGAVPLLGILESNVLAGVRIAGAFVTSCAEAASQLSALANAAKKASAKDADAAEVAIALESAALGLDALSCRLERGPKPDAGRRRILKA